MDTILRDDVSESIACNARERDMVRYMELLAVSEASNRRLLPERFAVWGIDQIATELETARRRALSR